ncbi:hypothetical protein [Magnetospirillum sp. 15-1]|uniref:hypothetical protein n=1 Tax=Magnetospirillum sp. 15-1 TaxID=1979370 RepID=UPI000BBC90E8|nr:hypothetical protein [Magnetospirillum sp. 15-1]
MPRYSRVGLRVVHVVGTVLLAEAVLAALAKRGKLWPRLLALAVAVLVLQQVRAVGASLDNAQFRGSESPAAAALVAQVTTEADSLARHLAGLAAQPPRVYLFTQGQQGFEWIIARQAGLKASPPGHWRYRLMEGFSWGAQATTVWTGAGSAEDQRHLFVGADVLWPLVADPACLVDLTGYFLLRNHGGGFDCVPKAGGGQAVRP